MTKKKLSMDPMHRVRRRNESSISAIVSILVLLLITIAAGVIVYSYVMSFVGNSFSTENSSKLFQDQVSIDQFCTSSGSQCNSSAYSLIMRNRGTDPIVGGSTFELYFTDVSRGTSASVSCQLSSLLAPGSVTSCVGASLPSSLSAMSGDRISLKVVGPDGSETISSSTVLSSETDYVPITLENSEPSPTQDDLQQLVNVNFHAYRRYLANDAGNIRFFNSSNFTTQNELPAWLENYTGDSSANNATSSSVWIDLAGTIVPPESQTVIYMVFESLSTEFDGVYWGEAPQLSPSYGAYDNGANVFIYYNTSPSNTSDWTVQGTAGVTATAPAGSYFQTQEAFYANSAKGDYLYAQVPQLATNEVITFWTYTTGQGDVYFLTDSAGNGQTGRLDGRGGSGQWAGLATSTSWTSRKAPSSGLHESKNIWYKYDIVLNGSKATSYVGPNTNNLDTLGSPANSLSISNNGNYLGMVGDALGSGKITYWNGLIIRFLPPNGVDLSASFGAFQ